MLCLASHLYRILNVGSRNGSEQARIGMTGEGEASEALAWVLVPLKAAQCLTLSLSHTPEPQVERVDKERKARRASDVVQLHGVLMYL